MPAACLASAAYAAQQAAQATEEPRLKGPPRLLALEGGSGSWDSGVWQVGTFGRGAAHAGGGESVGRRA